MSASRKICIETTLPQSCCGMRIDAALALILPDYSRSQLAKWLKQKDITIDGGYLKPHQKIKGHEHIVLNVELLADDQWLPQELPLDVVYEDNALLVINKAAGLVVHPGAGNPDQTLVNALLHAYPTLAQLPRAGIIHRLDKDTTGLLIVAKTLESYTRLNEAMQKRLITRRYQALVYGHIATPLTIDTFMGRCPNNRTKMAVTSQGRRAITHVMPNEYFSALTLLDIQLETGRTHQIRVHMTSIQHPLVGDQTYYNKQMIAQAEALLNFPIHNTLARQALHAYQIELNHPSSGKPLTVSQPLPNDFAALLDKVSQLESSDPTP